MSESLVDRVARAIATNAGGDYDKMRTRKVFYRKQARAAIAAMREPTREMTRVGEIEYERNFQTINGNADGIRLSYLAMIDAALAKEEKA